MSLAAQASESNIQNGPLLVYAHAFGVQSSIRDNVHFLDDHVVLYPVGRHVALFNSETKAMTFIREQEKVEGITAIAVSPNKKHMALCERMAGESSSPQVSMYNVSTEKRLRVLTCAEVASREYVGACFSADSKYLVTMGGGPDHTLVYWQWVQSKVLSVIRVGSPATRVRFNPWDSTQVSVTGPKLLRFFRLQEGALRGYNALLGRREVQDFTEHAWVGEERLVAATAASDLWVFDQGELHHVMPCVHPPDQQITALATHSRGVVVAGTGGLLTLLDASEGKAKLRPGAGGGAGARPLGPGPGPGAGAGGGEDPYAVVKTLRTGQGPAFTSVAVSPSEELLVACTSNGQLLSFPLQNVDIVGEGHEPFAPLVAPFHGAAVTGLDVCVRKPLAATCGADGSVRLWNYLDRTAELVKFFPDEPLCVALHPSGFHLLAGFADKLRFLNVHKGDLRVFQELSIKACREARFAHGGHLFAAASQTNVNVYATYTLECLAVLKGHTGPVRSLAWSPDDLQLVSAGLDGAVYEWGVKGFKRTEESVLKTCQYSCACYTRDAAAVLAVGSDKKLREIVRGATGAEVAAGTAARLTQVAVLASDRTVLAATSTGALRTYPYPFPAGGKAEHHEYPAAKGMVTRVRVSPDGQLVFAAGEDGSVWLFEVHHVDHGEVLPRRPADRSGLMDLLLVSKDELDEKDAGLADMESRVAELQMQSEYQLHLREQQWHAQLARAREEADAGEAAGEQRYEALRRRKEEMERELMEREAALERQHMRAAEELEAVYERKLAVEAQRYRELQQERDDIKYRAEELLERTRQAHAEELRAAREAAGAALAAREDEAGRLREEAAGRVRQYEEMLEQEKADYEGEIVAIKQAKAGELDEERHLCMTYKGETAFLRNKFDSFRQEMDDLRRELRLRDGEIRRLEKQGHDLERTIALLKRDIAEREESIEKKERTVNELKNRNKELEKFKFVLDFKLREVRREAEPREEQLEGAREQLREMDEELERDARTAAALEMALADRQAKLDAANGQLARVRRQLAERERTIGAFAQDLHDLVQLDSGAWRDALRRLHQTYVASEGPLKAAEASTVGELSRQREYMERQLATLKGRGEQAERAQRGELQRKVGENSFLIGEVNRLRAENKQLRNEISLLSTRLHDQESELRAQSRAQLREARPGTAPRPEDAGAPALPPAAGDGGGAAGAGARRPISRMGRAGRVARGSTLVWGEVVGEERRRAAGVAERLEESEREVEMQRAEIARLREQLRGALRARPHTSAPRPAPPRVAPRAPPAATPTEARRITGEGSLPPNRPQSVEAVMQGYDARPYTPSEQATLSRPASRTAARLS